LNPKKQKSIQLWYKYPIPTKSTDRINVEALPPAKDIQMYRSRTPVRAKAAAAQLHN